MSALFSHARTWLSSTGGILVSGTLRSECAPMTTRTLALAMATGVGRRRAAGRLERETAICA